ncbi:DNA-directed RNA polymerases II and IV subunit 5A-like [Arachis duranensis]|uniref:DNA-directed RNA polymerases II and IV subunit 5A-like n=1 Tax=Arachis duranensis TaxID=130453 RepID=A0A6P4B3Y1_ARADU|nr:DNA-directed RNA polymerases II and IV subunit 5A-like [Arachis duranensis]
MVLSEDEVKNLYRIRKTVLQMLRDRGYLVSDLEINNTIEEFKKEFDNFVGKDREDLVINKCKKDNPSEQIYVFFPSKRKVGVGEIKAYTKRMHSQKVFNAILVCQEKITEFAQRSITEISSQFHWVVFQENELLFNVTEHELVPVHQVLTDAEKNALLEKYTLEGTQLPKIQVDDPVAKYYGLKPGQVVKIIKPSETAGRYVTYRYVV